ncbi:MAG: response regulator [Pseudomonadales bacterium]|nr:response regulator [Pseudomonadales bacterium]NRA17206.1 response regulator [Oceanospirillaceae bacterium]
MSHTLKVTICDDSRLAQRQLALAIKNWNADISFADNGQMAIEAINDGRADLLFLDLNMPIMDGYQALQAIRDQDLPTLVIVVSGDIQERALQRVTELGAIAFIKKPISLDKLNQIIEDYGLVEQLLLTEQALTDTADQEVTIHPTQEERFSETANIAMGKAADRLAILLDTFISLSIPTVNLISNSELYMMIKGTSENDFTATISQGFVGGGISGESILITDKSGLPHIAQLLGFSAEIDADLERDILVDLAGLLSSSFLKAYFQQIGISHINQGIPAFLDYKGQLDHLLKGRAQDKTLAIEVTYSIPSHEIYCDLLLLFTLDSIEPMDQRSELFSWTL